MKNLENVVGGGQSELMGGQINYCTSCGADLDENCYGIHKDEFVQCTICGTRVEKSAVTVQGE